MVRANTPVSVGYRFRPGDKPAGQCPAALPGAKSRPSLREPDHPPIHAVQQAWREFVERYEEFTDLLCVSAKKGVCSGREARYAAVRSWLLERYPHIAPRLRPFFHGSWDNSAAALTLVDPVSEHRRALDCFESLLVPPTLEELFRDDSGALIDKVSRLSEAVYKCDDILMLASPVASLAEHAGES